MLVGNIYTIVNDWSRWKYRDADFDTPIGQVYLYLVTILFYNLDNMGDAGQVAAAGINAVSQQAINLQNIEFQRGENSKNRRFQHDEAELQRDWQSDEWTRQFEAQRDEWYKQQEYQYGAQFEQWRKQFDYESEYNTPRAQAGRMAEAGLNPSAVLGQQGGLVSAQHMSPTSSPQASVPTGGSVSGAAAGAPAMASSPQLRNPFEGFAQTIKDLSEASRTNKSLEPMIAELQSRAYQQLMDAGLKESMKSYTETKDFILSMSKDAHIAQAFRDLDATISETALNYAKTNQVKESTVLAQLNQVTEVLEQKLKGEELTKAKFAVSTMYTTWKKEMNLLDSQANNQNAQAGQARANTALLQIDAATRDKMNAAIIELRTQMAANAKEDAVFKDASFNNRLGLIVSELEKNGAMTDQLKEAAERARKENDAFALRLFLDVANTYINGFSAGTQAAGAAASFFK